MKPRIWLSSPFWRKLSDISLNGFLAIVSAALIVDLIQAAYTNNWPIVNLVITTIVATAFGLIHLIANFIATHESE